jgi:hypothetical protein
MGSVERLLRDTPEVASAGGPSRNGTTRPSENGGGRPSPPSGNRARARGGSA